MTRSDPSQQVLVIPGKETREMRNFINLIAIVTIGVAMNGCANDPATEGTNVYLNVESKDYTPVNMAFDEAGNMYVESEIRPAPCNPFQLKSDWLQKEPSRNYCKHGTIWDTLTQGCRLPTAVRGKNEFTACIDQEIEHRRDDGHWGGGL